MAFDFLNKMRTKTADAKQDAAKRYREVILGLKTDPTPKQVTELESLMDTLGLTPSDVEDDLNIVKKIRDLEARVVTGSECERLRLELDRLGTEHQKLVLKHFEETEALQRKVIDASAAWREAREPGEKLEQLNIEVRTGTRYARLYGEIEAAQPELAGSLA